jgi:hypothetical protein
MGGDPVAFGLVGGLNHPGGVSMSRFGIDTTHAAARSAVAGR